MDQFVTTYRRDYLWPYIRSFGQKLVQDGQLSGLERKDTCPCYPPKGISQQYVDHNFNPEGQDWSRTGPMGALIDPKLYPVKVGKSPESETMREDQPNVFLRKLQEKYPFLYEILQTAPSSDIVAKSNLDRLRTTYQVDYCGDEQIPPDDMMRSGGLVLGPCPETVKLPGEVYPANPRTIAFRPALITKSAATKCPDGDSRGGGGGGGGGGGDGGIGVWTFNKTEYQDNISKLGSLIIRDKLHYHSRKPA